MNRIEWKKKAQKQLAKLQRRDALAVFNGVDTLKQFPGVANVKKLTKHQYQYRLRVGNFRVFFEFDGGVKVVYIEEVKKRDERTY